MPVPRPRFEFELGRIPVAPEEARLLEADVAAHGLDGRYWSAMNGLLTTASRSDTPLVLRGRRDGRLRAAACLVECRRTNQCLFPGRLGRTLDVVPTPSYYWTRGDAGVDLLGSAGFVAPGEDRTAFYQEAVAFLNSRYLFGIVMDLADSAAAASCVQIPMMDWGRCPVSPGGVDALFRQHKNLRRKVASFRNKGGTLERVDGPLAEDDVRLVLHCLEQSAQAAPLRAPFQENYRNMVSWASRSGAPGVVHFLARIEGTLVGYHSYLRTGTRLQCLSGGFDRTRPTTCHAYENILLDTMRYAEEEGLSDVAFGPVTNPTKAALMPVLAPCVGRFYSRHAWLRGAMSAIVPRSALRRAAPLARAVA